jgi:iron complex transport system ATP-binding protein
VQSSVAFTLSGVRLVEQGRVVLHDLDWAAQHDERWVVLGPNGSGKTSMLRLLAFTRAPSHGTVTVLGDTYGAVDVRRVRRRIGLASSALLQQLRPTLSAHDVVVMGADAALEPWWSTYDDAQHARADELLLLVGCAGHARQELATLSEGERKRVLVARLLMAEPDLLLFDEPCAGLDLGGREALVSLLGDLALGDDRPLVLVTHHLEEIPAGFTHVLLLRDGAVVAAGPIAETLTSAAVSATFDLDVRVREDTRAMVRPDCVVPGGSVGKARARPRSPVLRPDAWAPAHLH